MSETLEFWQTPFWHWDAGTVQYNSALSGGWCESVSQLRAREGLENMVTPYSAGHGDKEKEIYWETVRREHYPHKPSRDGALFVLPTKEDAYRAGYIWFSQENRTLIEIRIPISTSLHIADTAHLDIVRDDWEAAAHRYWSGQLSDDREVSIPEVIVHGWFFVPQIIRLTVET